MTPKSLLAALILTLSSLPGLAQDFAKGLAAFETGDHSTALEEWQPLAEQGNTKAQYDLGYMYGAGLGIPLDHVEAARWYRLAAEQGDAEAQSRLDALTY